MKKSSYHTLNQDFRNKLIKSIQRYLFVNYRNNVTTEENKYNIGPITRSIIKNNLKGEKKK